MTATTPQEARRMIAQAERRLRERMAALREKRREAKRESLAGTSCRATTKTGQACRRVAHANGLCATHGGQRLLGRYERQATTGEKCAPGTVSGPIRAHARSRVMGSNDA